MCQIWIIWSEFILKIWVLNIYETEVIFIYIQNDIPTWKSFIFSIKSTNLPYPFAFRLEYSRISQNSQNKFTGLFRIYINERMDVDFGIETSLKLSS